MTPDERLRVIERNARELRAVLRTMFRSYSGSTVEANINAILAACAGDTDRNFNAAEQGPANTVDPAVGNISSIEDQTGHS